MFNNIKLKNMKKIILSLMIIFAYVDSYSQCSPNSLYQDSTYNIWPDTIVNLPIVVQSMSYHAELNIKTPATLIEAAGGDSTFTQLDTVILGASYSFQLADWPVDSMSLVSIDGLPNGLSLSCEYANCILPGNVLTCAAVDGTTSDPLGVYPVTIWVDVYTHGSLDLGIIQYPLSTSLFEATGSYESVSGYKIVISNTSSYEIFNSNKFTLLQNTPNPTKETTTIQFNTPNSQMIRFQIIDMFGKLVYSDNIISEIGLNTIEFNDKLSPGIYTYSVQNDKRIVSKRMIISD
tara:strand:- start:7 stop:879 length:873 start_codon:yes stop_codon:yes gene_type:complete